MKHPFEALVPQYAHYWDAAATKPDRQHEVDRAVAMRWRRGVDAPGEPPDLSQGGHRVTAAAPPSAM